MSEPTKRAPLWVRLPAAILLILAASVLLLLALISAWIALLGPIVPEPDPEPVSVSAQLFIALLCAGLGVSGLLVAIGLLRESPGQRRPLDPRLSVLLWIGAGLVAALSLRFDPKGVFWPIASYVFLAYLFAWPLTLLHEAAHAGVARLVGLRVSSVIVGRGLTLFERTRGRFFIQLNLVPSGGLTFFSPGSMEGVRWPVFWAILAGPMVHLLLLPPTWWLWRRASPEAPIAFAAINALFVLNTALLIGNLIPWRARSYGARTPADGLQLLWLVSGQREALDRLRASYLVSEGLILLRVGRVDEALALMEKAAALLPEESAIQLSLTVPLIEKRQYTRSREILQRLLERPDVVGRVRAVVLNNLAWSDLRAGDPSLLPEADQSSAEALRLMALPNIRGTRGAVLVTLGRPAEGLPLLQKTLRHATEPRDRAETLCHIALAKRQLGRDGEAERDYRTARELAPHSALVIDTEAALRGPQPIEEIIAVDAETTAR